MGPLNEATTELIAFRPRKITPAQNATDGTTSQVRRLVKNLNVDIGAAPPLFVFDAGYDPIVIGEGLSRNHAQVLVRISSKRVFHVDPTSASGGRGRPPLRGARFALSSPGDLDHP